MIFVKESVIAAKPERVFAFHERPEALRLLMPPWERARIVEHPPTLEVGAVAVIAVRVLGLWKVRWVAEHTAYDPPRMFEDVQATGPFKHWRHRHIVLPHKDGAVLRDVVDYEPPLGFIGVLADPFVIAPRLRKLFAYRHAVTREWCEGGLAQD